MLASEVVDDLVAVRCHIVVGSRDLALRTCAAIRVPGSMISEYAER